MTDRLALDIDWRVWLDSAPYATGRVEADGRYGYLNRELRLLLNVTTDAEGRRRTDLLREVWLPRLREPALLAAYLDDLDRGAVTAADLWLLDEHGRAWRYRSRPLLDGDRLLSWREDLIPAPSGEEPPLTVDEDFIARISHELRTPMTAMMGFCHLLVSQEEQLPPAQHTAVQKVLKNASILLQLLNDVLDMARIRTGNVRLAPEPLDLEQVIEDAVTTVEPQIWEKDLELRVVIGDVPVIVSDRLKIKQIIINLLSNAVKYTDHGHVTVSAQPADDGVVLAVADTGTGIPDDSLRRIFSAYAQDDPGKQHRRSPSTGLGLAICRRLARLLKGKIQVTSQLGEGSCFTLWLPLELVAESTPASE